MHFSYNEYILGKTTIVRSYNKCQRKRAYVQELSMEKILQSKTFSVFGLLLICALFVITYKSVPFQQIGSTTHTGTFDSNLSHIFKYYSKFWLPYEDGLRDVMGVKWQVKLCRITHYLQNLQPCSHFLKMAILVYWNGHFETKEFSSITTYLEPKNTIFKEKLCVNYLWCSKMAIPEYKDGCMIADSANSG